MSNIYRCPDCGMVWSVHPGAPKGKRNPPVGRCPDCKIEANLRAERKKHREKA